MKKILFTTITFLVLSHVGAQEKGEFIDSRDGKIYKTIKIDDKVWMAENLAYKPESGNYWAYDDDSTNVVIYGYLYDFKTAKKACPPGWRLPNEDEWRKLEKHLIKNGYNWDGSTKKNRIGKALSATFGWKDSGFEGEVGNNQKSNNTSGFSALPGGVRIYSGFTKLGEWGGWWTGTGGLSLAKIYARVICYDLDAFGKFQLLIEDPYMYSVRCVKK